MVPFVGTNDDDEESWYDEVGDQFAKLMKGLGGEAPKSQAKPYKVHPTPQQGSPKPENNHQFDDVDDILVYTLRSAVKENTASSFHGNSKGFSCSTERKQEQKRWNGDTSTRGGRGQSKR